MEYQGKMAEMMNAGSDMVKGMKKTEVKDWRTKFFGPAKTPNGEKPTP